MDISAILWFGLLVIFLMVESSTVTLISIWFAAGSLAAIIASLCGAEFWLEAVIGVGVSVILLASLRPLLRKYFTPKIEKTNVDSVVGKQGIVIASVDNIQGSGRIKLGGMEWSARSTDGQPIEEGTQVRVDRIEGVKAYVTAI